MNVHPNVEQYDEVGWSHQCRNTKLTTMKNQAVSLSHKGDNSHGRCPEKRSVRAASTYLKLRSMSCSEASDEVSPSATSSKGKTQGNCGSQNGRSTRRIEINMRILGRQGSCVILESALVLKTQNCRCRHVLIKCP